MKQKGITLIGLIITVVILLILTAVSIGIANEGDIINKAKYTTNETEKHIDSQQEIINDIRNMYK